MAGKVYLVDSDVGLASFNNVQLSIYSGTLQVEHVPLMRRLHMDVAAAYPRAAVTLCVIMPECTMPNAEARKAVGQLLEQTIGSERAAAFVIEGKGLAGSAMRAMLSTLIIASRGKHPSKVFEQGADAVHWVSEQCGKLGVEVSARELTAMSQDLRQQVLARSQAPLASAAQSEAPRKPTTSVR